MQSEVQLQGSGFQYSAVYSTVLEVQLQGSGF